MTDIPVSLLFNFFIFLLFPFLLGLLSKKFRISPIVGYIISGLILGNLFNNIISKEIINNFAYFGIILLLFTVGLEINFYRIILVKKFIVIGGIFQLLLSALFITLLSSLFGFPTFESLLIGLALSSSSTTLVAKIIQDRGEENSFIGEIALGILMFQDIAFIPFFIIFISITQQSTFSIVSIFIDILFGLAKSTIIIVVLFYLGRSIVPVVFNKIAKISRESLNLFIIVFIFFITYLSLILNIPILIGVFIAGILVGQTLEHYHIFSEIRPFRDLLSVIFFVYIGTNIKLVLIWSLIPQILLFSILVIIIKAIIVFIIFLFFKFHSKTAFTLGLYLFQIDEDAFILMSTLFVNRIITENDYLFIITSVLISLVLTPIVIKNKDKMYIVIRKFIKRFLPFIENFIKYRIDRDQSPIDVISISDHIVICGYGRIGSYIGRSLMLANIPFVAIDYNFHIVDRAKKEGVNIIYGDPGDIDILDYAQVDEAAIIILTLPESSAQEAIVLHAKKLNPQIIIFSRVHRDIDKRRMKDLGVDIVVQPEFEASLSIIKKIYLWKKIPKEDAINKIKRLKIEHGMA